MRTAISVRERIWRLRDLIPLAESEVEQAQTDSIRAIKAESLRIIRAKIKALQWVIEEKI